jgi:hypothetical protein
MSNSTEVKDILSLIEQLDANTNFAVFLPSLQKEVNFKQLTTEQLKRLLKTVIDSPLYNTEFTTTFNSIIKESCLDETVNIDALTIYDKLMIFFKIRIESVSKEYTFNLTKDDTNDSKKKYTINLNEHFNKFAAKQIIVAPETLAYGECIAVCDLPSLKTENHLEKELHKNIKLEVSTPEELRNIVGETFINEVTKFITTLTISNSVIDLTQHDFKTRIKIVEKLPTNLINKVIKYIETYRNTVKELLSYNLQF